MPLVAISALSFLSHARHNDDGAKACEAPDCGIAIFGRLKPSCTNKGGKAFVATLDIKGEGAGAVFSDYEGRGLRVKHIFVGGRCVCILSTSVLSCILVGVHLAVGMHVCFGEHLAVCFGFPSLRRWRG